MTVTLVHNDEGELVVEETGQLVACHWFALCDHPATSLREHPVLGAVPICTRCEEKVAR